MSSFSPAELKYMENHIGDHRSGQIYAASAVCVFVSYFAVVLRLIARGLTKARYGIDDLFILTALLSFTGYVISSSLTTHYGMGKHIILVTNPKSLNLTLLACECLYLTTIPLIKLSILCFYRRIFPQRWFKFTLVSVGAIVIAYSIAQLFGVIFQCVPMRKLWIPTVAGRCINFRAFAVAGGVPNIVTDFIILALPMPILWHLEIPTRQKRMLSIVFSIGGCACIAAILRLYYAQALNSADSTYNDVGGLVVTSVECSAGVVSACIPTLRPLLNRPARGLVANSLRWPTLREQKEEEQIRLSSTARSANKGWSNIRETSDMAIDEEAVLPYERP